jgi:hypothetical protein
MVKIGVLALAAVCLCTVAAAQTTPDKPATVNERLENQRERIHAGVADDQLTKREATQLRADDAAIRAEEHVYRKANDGTLTHAERRQLNRQLNRTSQRIHRDRHNGRKPQS